jgi:4-hydroxybenzoate polyprenyltransferase
MRLFEWIHYPVLAFMICFVIGGNPLPVSFAVFVATALGAYHVYSVNDYYDGDSRTWFVGGISLFMCLLLSAWISFPSAFVWMLIAFINYFYSVILKKYPFIDVVSIFMLASLCIMFSTLQVTVRSVIFSSLFGWLAAVAHPLQSLRDYKEDSKRGRRTVAIFLGSNTKRFSAILLVLFMFYYVLFVGPVVGVNPFLILVYFPVFFVYYISDNPVLIWISLKVASALFFIGIVCSYLL